MPALSKAAAWENLAAASCTLTREYWGNRPRFCPGFNVGQDTKGPRWMPWRQGPKKGVARLRKASVSRLAGVTGDARMGKPLRPTSETPGSTLRPGEVSGGTETSQYPEENKSTEIPLVVANERGRA